MNLKTKATLILLTIFLITSLMAPVIAEPLTVTDLSKNTYNFTMDQLMEMPQTTEYAELYCYGNLITSGYWNGVQLNYLLSNITINSEVNSIQLTAQDLYTITIPIQLANSPQTIIAYQKNGTPLSEGLRLVLPGYNGAAWIAQIVSISTSNNIVSTPASISIDGSMPRDALSEFNGVATNPPGTFATAKPTPIPTIKSTIDNPTSNPTTPIQNNTVVVQPHQQQTVNQQSFGFDQIVLVLVTTILIVIVSVAVGIKRQRNRVSVL